MSYRGNLNELKGCAACGTPAYCQPDRGPDRGRVPDQALNRGASILRNRLEGKHSSAILDSNEETVRLVEAIFQAVAFGERI